MINFIKGFIIGIGKIIPGVSGAMLATIMGVYDKAIGSTNAYTETLFFIFVILRIILKLLLSIYFR